MDRLCVKLILAITAICALPPARIVAFVPGTYAERSVLADGKWVSIEIEKSGPVKLTASNLRKWGFPDPGTVKVYGAGGRRINDILSLDNYIDDLPQVQIRQTTDGIVFYASGPEEWTKGSSDRFTHALNPFASKARYFITDSDGMDRREIKQSGITPTGHAATTFTEHIYHELDQTSPGESGHMLLGEDLRYTPVRSFTFNLPDIEKDSEAWIQTRIVTDIDATATLVIKADGNTIGSPTRIGATSAMTYGTLTSSASTFTPTSDKTLIEITLSAQGTVRKANIDCIDINYTRVLRMPSSGYLEFTLDSSEGSFAGAPSDMQLWDITDPLNLTNVTYTIDKDGNAVWRSSFGPDRKYMAWSEKASIPTPDKATDIANQNLHYTGNGSPDMVIFAPAAWISQAERIADIHRNDTTQPLQVQTVAVEQVYNEFGSGIADIGALRRMLKMIYDRSEVTGRSLKYALLLGRPTHDNRRLTPDMSISGQTWLPTWQSDESLREYDSYTSDDILAFLDDGSGARMSSDRYSIAVGRIPAGTLQDVTAYVDKLHKYISEAGGSDGREWKNRVLIVADDGNAGRHMKQTESMAANMLSTPGGQRMMYTKAYVDAFDITGGTCTGARERMMQSLDDGTMLWTFTGHAGRNFLTGDNMLTYTDISNLHPRYLPFFIGATCSFMRWDGSQPSGSEIMALNPSGGVIGVISATREVFIDENGKFTDALGHEIFRYDSNGRIPTIGEAYMNTKNRLASPYGQSNTNKLRYALLGDPAMRLAMPDNDMLLDNINGTAVNPEAETWPEIKAGQTAVITGSVRDTHGNIADNFNGSLSVTLYDAEYSTTSSGRTTKLDGEGERVTFEEQGEKLFAGRDSVVNGLFTIKIPMPREVADNYRPAALTMYARSANDGNEAAGICRSFYVYGYDDSTDDDTTPPSIEYAYLNHETFTEGSAVNPDPMFIARITDNVGINLSQAGIGRRMTLTLDKDTGNSITYDNVASYYTPSIDGSPSGVIAYPLSSLAPGNHTLTLKVWDTSDNSAERTIGFSVDERIRPTLFNVWTDANPASTSTNFYVNHNRPDATLKVTVSVYDLMGRLVWTSTATDRSDMFRSAPVGWDLRDMGGRRVGRGIYVYKVLVNEPGSDTAPGCISGRIAVTAR